MSHKRKTKAYYYGCDFFYYFFLTFDFSKTKTSSSLGRPLEETGNERKGEWMGVNSCPDWYALRLRF